MLEKKKKIEIKKDKSKKDKPKWSKKKLLLLICSIVIVLGLSVYGIAKVAFGYEIHEYDGIFPYSTGSWSYNTENGRRYCDFTWNGKTVHVEPGEAGYTVTSKNGTYEVVVNEFEAAEELVPQWPGIQVGDRVYWQSDSAVRFKFDNGVFEKSEEAKNVAEAEALNNTDWSAAKAGLKNAVSSMNFDYWASNKGPFYFVIQDNTGTYAYCWKFSTAWTTLKQNNYFDIEPVTLRIEVYPDSAGSVSGGGGYLPGTKVSISASAHDGYEFEGWYEDGVKISDSADYQYELPNIYANGLTCTLTAKFTGDGTEKEEYTLTTSANPSEGGTVEGDSGTVLNGDTVRIEAVPAEGYRFAGWTSTWSGFTGTSASVSFTMPAENVALVANFVKGEPDPTVTEAPEATPTPTEVPPATPSPTEQPSGNSYSLYSDTYYYSTDDGYCTGTVVSSGKIADKKDTSGRSISEIAYYYSSSKGYDIESSTSYKSLSNTLKKESYLTGKDEAGNTWYFKSGENNTATYVHPKTYNGYEVDSSSIKNITTLIIPSTITSGDTEYTVTHIGGWGKYHMSGEYKYYYNTFI